MRVITLAIAVLLSPNAAFAGCIGPVILGDCKGQIVEWDTHPQGPSHTPPATSGFYYDKRGTSAEQVNPGSINPFSGRDAHDADMDAQRRMRCYQQRDEAMQRGAIVSCP